MDFGSRIIELKASESSSNLGHGGAGEFPQHAQLLSRRGWALLVFDVTRRETFTHLERWLQETKQFASQQICITLVGNKADLNKEGNLKEEAEKLQTV